MAQVNVLHPGLKQVSFFKDGEVGIRADLGRNFQKTGLERPSGLTKK